MVRGMNTIDLTRALVSFQTINPPGNERECAVYIARILEEAGFRVNLVDFDQARTSLIADIGAQHTPPICFTGHIDTVPLGAVQWSRNPFGGEIDGDRIYGRGSSDMKGGLAAMIVSALTLAHRYPGKVALKLVITSGEETGSQGAACLAGRRDVLGDAGALVVGEPTANYPFVAHKGALWIEASTSGVTAHGSMPEMGVNAIYPAARAVKKLQEFDFSLSDDPLLGKPTLNVGTISGGININSVPDKAAIGIDIRSISGQSHETITNDLQAWLGKDVFIRKLMDVPSVYTDPEHEWIQQVFDVMTPILAGRPIPRGVNYFTDASILTPAFGGIPTVILGPGEPHMAHKTDEYCLVSRIEQAVEAYTEIARRWCGM